MYTVGAAKIPKPVSNVVNQWSVESDRPNTARVTSRITANAKGLVGTLMGLMMKRQLSKFQRATLEDLRVYVETGRVTEAKQEAIAEAT